MCPILKGWGSSIKRDGAERGREKNAYAEELTQPQRLLQRTDAEEELPHGHLGTLVKIDADGAHVSDSPLKKKFFMHDTCEKQPSTFIII